MTPPRVSLIAPNSISVERHAYCLCLHVRPATIFIAVMNLAGSLLCSILTIFVLMNKDYFIRLAQPTYQPSSSYYVRIERMNFISVLIYLLLSLVSAMLLYGVIKSKPRYILPFFGIQIIDYLFTLPQFFASMTHPYYYYVSETKQMMDLQQQEPGDQFEWERKFPEMWYKYPSEFNKGGSQLSPSTSNNMYSTSLLILTLLMIYKTYCLCVVWKCYRYLHMKELILPITLNVGNFLDTESMLVNGHNRSVNAAAAAAAAANVPPPNYEEATKLPECKPPEYAVVIGYDPVVVMPPATEDNNASEGSISRVQIKVSASTITPPKSNGDSQTSKPQEQ